MTGEELVLVVTDLEASTRGWRRYRAPMHDLVAAYVDLVERRLQPVPRIESFTGDGHVLSFPSTEAALSAALRLRELWNQRRRSFGRPEWENTHRLKIAVHAGQVHRLDESHLIGGEIAVCARICKQTLPDEILVSSHADRLLEDRTRYEWGGNRPEAAETESSVRPLVGYSGRDASAAAPKRGTRRSGRLGGAVSA